MNEAKPFTMRLRLPGDYRIAPDRLSRVCNPAGSRRRSVGRVLQTAGPAPLILSSGSVAQRTNASRQKRGSIPPGPLRAAPAGGGLPYPRDYKTTLLKYAVVDRAR
jgi:hypothetical protein